jgi:hypothetical protein
VSVDATDPAIQEELDRLSLHQALLDVEIANARVVDLTKRLLDLHDELARKTWELEALQAEHERLKADVTNLTTSRSYRLAVRLGELRRLLRG